jgi:hypothetical protein
MVSMRCNAKTFSTSVSSLRHGCLQAALVLAVVGFASLGSSLSAQVAASSGADPMVQRNIVDWAVQGKGVTEDWSDRHLVFPNPGTEADAIKNGTYEKWLKIVNEPRFIKQQIRRAGGVQVLESAAGLTPRTIGTGPILLGRGSGFLGPKKVSLTKDWSMDLGSGGHMAAGQYPAKFSFTTNMESCSDYVVYPTGLLGSGTQATIISYNNLYGGTGGTCGSAATRPSVDWAYNTGGTSKLSPVISDDGSQVAYIQVTGGVASLVVLKPSNSGGTAGAPFAIGAAVANSAYRNCVAPCYTTIALNGTPNDTNSSPFYIYGAALDTLYVGDNSGKIHQFTGVFYGTPAEPLTQGFPVTTTAAATLTSPIYDSNSNLLFVGDSGGFLYSVTTTGATQTVHKSAKLDSRTGGIADAPLVDSAPATPLVYVFVGDSGGTSLVEQFPTGFAAGASATHTETIASGTGAVAATTIYDGAFDNIHYDGNGTTGNLYVCGVHASGVQSRLYQIVMNGTFTGAVNSPGTDPSGNTSTCSPVTEFLSTKVSTTINEVGGITAASTTVTVAANTSIVAGDYIQIDSEIILVSTVSGGTTVNFTPVAGHRGQLGTTAAAHATGAAVTDIQDWIYLSVTAGGTGGGTGGCATACLYNYLITSGTVPAAASFNLHSTGGTSGIIIDNSAPSSASAASGEAQIYYTTLGNQACVGNGTSGNGTGGCAVQTLQSAP